MARSKLRYIIGVVMLLMIGTSCSISYKFNGATIDYTRIKTVTIEDFPNQAPLVYPPLSQMFSERLRENFEAGNIVLTREEISMIDSKLETMQFEVFGGHNIRK